ncbi:hypothetical protein F5Y16DRAFT_287561 [Xylariaceae sp. FL0255]|nr:hypothetical protein F5Y16DRAFT_287561 [Xylariaceae sp. FL0255]
MAPLTRVWFFTLNANHSIIEAAFRKFWNEILTTAAAYSSFGEPHVLLQSDDEPDQLALISGYPTQEASLELQQAWGDKLVPRVLEFITHKQLLISDLDVRELPLDSGKIAVLVKDDYNAAAETELPGHGTWATEMPSLLFDTAAKEAAQQRRCWVQVAASEDVDRLRAAGYTRKFSSIMEVRIVASE